MNANDSEIICLLCSEDISIYALGECNHKFICHVCTLKMRDKCKDTACPLCKKNLDKIIITDKLNAQYSEFDFKRLIAVKDFYYENEQQRYKVEALNQFKCVVSICKDVSTFPSMLALKRHLKDHHNRLLCDVCLDNRTCVLNEQILYSTISLKKHQNQGDYDEDGNLVFFHPYCKYCAKLFYDDDKFKSHLNNAHYICELCGPNYKFTFYRDHQSFERHQRMSHYICETKECKEVMRAFSTSAELEHHQITQHAQGQRLAVNQANFQQLTGFYQEDTQDKKQRKELNDNEGTDFSDQFMSFKKMKLRALVEVDSHQNENIDIRDFYCREYNDIEDEQLDKNECLYDEEESKYEHKGRSGGYQDRSNGKDRDHGKFKLKDKSIESAVVDLEDLIIYKLTGVPQMYYDQVLRKAMKFIEQSRKQEYKNAHFDLIDGKISASKFSDVVLTIMGPKTGFRLLCFYLNSKDLYEKKSIHKDLDDSVGRLIQKFPSRNKCLVGSSRTYADLFKHFLAELDKNLLERIRTCKLNINKRREITIDKERIFQLTEVLRHVRTQEMGKLKFAVNFGLSVVSLEIARKFILLDDLSSVQKHLLKIPNKEILALYLYSQICLQILKGEKIHKEKDEINKYILSDFFKRNADFIASHKDESSESSEEELKVKVPQGNLNTHNGRNGKAKNYVKPIEVPKIELSKYEFPTLTASQPLLVQQVKEVKSTWGNMTSVQFVGQGDNERAVQKQIKKEFPTLGDIQQPVPKPKPQNKVKQAGFYELDESFAPLSGPPQQQVQIIQQVQDPKPQPIYMEQQQVIGEIRKKGKKKVMLAGGFK